MLQIDMELGEAFYGEPDKEVEPERALLAAMVRQAIRDILVRPRIGAWRGKSPLTKQYQRQAVENFRLSKQQAWSWIMDEHYPDKAMSYEWICHALGRNPDLLRKRLLATVGKLNDSSVRPIQVMA